jgi:hypothetical protein
MQNLHDIKDIYSRIEVAVHEDDERTQIKIQVMVE